MFKNTEFLVFCIEVYKNKYGLSGQQVLKLFEKYSILEYLAECFDTLHTQSEEYIIDSIDMFINTRI